MQSCYITYNNYIISAKKQLLRWEMLFILTAAQHLYSQVKRIRVLQS